MFNRPFRLGEASAVSRKIKEPFFISLTLLILILLIWVVWKLVKIIRRWKIKRDLRAYYRKIKRKQNKGKK